MKDVTNPQIINCLLCSSTEAILIGTINVKPDRETVYNISIYEYERHLFLCRNCRVYFNLHNMLPENFYEASYNEATYNQNLIDTYNRIMALPLEESDNKNRVKRILNVLLSQGISPGDASVLDIGSGLCVFLGELKKHGCYCVCIDPDAISTKHAIENAHIDKAHTGTLNNFQSSNRFHLITLNKVLEHVKDPLSILLEAKRFLRRKGLIYVELPDGDGALKNGSFIDRQEFYIEHFTIFNSDSIRYLADQAGLKCLGIEKIHEPSNKYTTYTFMYQD